MKRPEILAPAGDMERLKYAFAYGADAVYLAYTSFGMRTACNNFTLEELQEAIEYAHSLDKKVYITLNVYALQEQISPIVEFLQKVEPLSPDAFLVADLGILTLIKKYAPTIPIHISTQANITNAASARAFYELGARRVVLARELSLEEIALIRKEVPKDLELECFVHGAMCMSVSGRCHLSQYMTGRDANQGGCAQPCRWSYSVMEQTREGQYFPVESYPEGSYIFNAKDLCMIEYLHQLCEAGIDSFKIEGRAKTFYYVAAVVKAYKEALDAVMNGAPQPQKALEEVQKVSHRGYSTGFYFGRPDADATNRETGGYIRHYDVVAIVESACPDGALIRQRNKFLVGDTLELLSPKSESQAFTVTKIINEAGEEVTSAPHADERLTLFTDPALTFEKMDIIRKKRTE